MLAMRIQLIFCSCFNPHPARRLDAMCLCKCHCRSFACFNPHPSPKAGCYTFGDFRKLRQPCFNPHPARRLDAITLTVIMRLSWRFNPHPARRLDAIRHGSGIRLPKQSFQSSSSPKAGCYIVLDIFQDFFHSFNPHPARRLDAII